MLHLILFLFFVPLVLAASESSIQLSGKVGCLIVTALLCVRLSSFLESKDAPSPFIPRKRRAVRSIFKEMGPYYFQRAYRMDEDNFWWLHRMLYANLGGRVRPRKGSKKKHRNGAKNGIISSPARLSAALRYFAGGRPDDIAIVHGISNTEVYRSVWRTVNAVNKCDSLRIQFPADHNQQRAIAAGFKRKSRAGFDNCAGAIDGILVWIEKPYLAECDDAQTGVKKFFCGRKKKFGMNMQAVCDHEGRFLDICIGHPASTSDFLCFATSPLKSKLEQRGFLFPGLCLFGDNAYVNTFYMATPWKGVKSGVKDDYNFYHSQVRIKIECAFGMLVARFGILRRAMPAQFGLRRTNALVMSLCRLHNFCINNRVKATGSLAVDAAEIEVHGGVPLVAKRMNPMSPEQLIRRDDHFDDTSRAFMRQLERQSARILQEGEVFPRDLMLASVVQQELKRPPPEDWK